MFSSVLPEPETAGAGKPSPVYVVYERSAAARIVPACDWLMCPFVVGSSE